MILFSRGCSLSGSRAAHKPLVLAIWDPTGCPRVQAQCRCFGVHGPAQALVASRAGAKRALLPAMPRPSPRHRANPSPPRALPRDKAEYCSQGLTSTHSSDKEQNASALTDSDWHVLHETAMTEARLSSSNWLRKQIHVQDVLSVKASLQNQFPGFSLCQGYCSKKAVITNLSWAA